MEEQRIIRPVIRYFPFWELEMAIAERAMHFGTKELNLKLFVKNDVCGFWCDRIDRSYWDQEDPDPRIQLSQISHLKAFLGWASGKDLTGSPSLATYFINQSLASHIAILAARTRSPGLSLCCPSLTASDPSWHEVNQPVLLPAAESILIQKFERERDIKKAGFEVYQQLGFDFWDLRRLEVLGFVEASLGMAEGTRQFG